MAEPTDLAEFLRTSHWDDADIIEMHRRSVVAARTDLEAIPVLRALGIEIERRCRWFQPKFEGAGE